MNKKFYFLAGLPRSGNTLFASVLNQNPEINVSSNSLLSSILYSIVDNNIVNLEKNLIYKNFPDKRSLYDSIRGCFTGYYENWNGSIIIDRSNWGTPYNLKMLEEFCPNQPKFICLVRPTLDVLCSFLRLYAKNGLIDIKNKYQVERTCEELMVEKGVVARGIYSVTNLLRSEYKDDVLLINYENLCDNTNFEINRVYNFLEIKPFKHKLKEIKQYKINGIEYNDNINDYYKDLHKLRKTIKKSSHMVSRILTPEIINRYKHLDFKDLNNQAFQAHLNDL